jgi:hypothetical protein
MSTEPAQQGAELAPTSVIAEPATARGPLLGRIALGAAVLFALLEIAAIVVGTARQWTLATLMGEAVIGLTVVSFLGGLAAVILKRGGGWGIGAMLVSVFANPLVQIALLGLIGNS